MGYDQGALDRALDALPSRYTGPGGVAGVVLDGKVVAARGWGHADLDAGRPLTRTTRLPVCSITKQFTCAAILAEMGDPSRLDARIAGFLPRMTGALPTTRQLADNRSGLRDYWALSILYGARAEQRLARADGLALMAAMRTGHFAPGSEYSYSNGNFRLLAEMLEAETGATLETLLRRHVWGPAGMASAAMTCDTSVPADGVVGYEGNDATGYLPAVNGAWWLGDAGMSASLDDMLAYEAWIDATRNDAGALYRRLADGAGDGPKYRMGLGCMTVAGRPATGHGGALRGFRAQRIHLAGERLSVVVMFNHEANAAAAATGLAEAALQFRDPDRAPISPDWAGQWLCAETGLVARITTDGRAATLHYATGGDEVYADGPDRLASRSVRLTRRGARLQMDRLLDGVSLVLDPLPGVDLAGSAQADGAGIAGSYHSAELGADMVIEALDGAVHARFAGMLGQGRFEQVVPAAPDLWLLQTRRALDAPAPGDWTMRIDRDATGQVAGLTLGCWLARGIAYVRK